MKCPKCYAENINEAMKCGVCGTRLKHVKQTNNLTGNSNVEFSVRRENKQEQSNPTHNIKPRQTAPIAESEGNQHALARDKANILSSSDAWQQAKDAGRNSQNQPKKKNYKIVWILLAVFMFGPAVLGVISSMVIPIVMSVIGSSNQDEAATTDEALPASEEVVSNEYQARYFDMQAYQARLAQYYDAKHRFATSLKDIEKFEQTQFSDFIFDQIEITQQGILVGKFSDAPARIYMVPQLENNQIRDWQCYRVAISDDLLQDCELLQADPYKL
ncbi:zinc ribbon domain-containing protein [Acinetobacter guillouiae]|uniref:zinc ribbon domain-containing protein n=1 Tax=Acinetobacter guillouiae TaxID=106649 RepID=UPI001D18C505|nr:zinc ribbon domain-containing protein [Acinetobacter guillouiae]